MQARFANDFRRDERQEREILARIAAGDRRAFERLFGRYHPQLFRFAYRMTASYEAAEELASDVLLTVWQSADRYAGAAKVSTWIFGIAYRKSLKRLRRRRILPFTLREHDVVDSQAAERAEREDWVRGGIGTLPAAQRLTVLLVYYVGLSCEETAAATGVPVNTVKTRMFHARRKLKAELRRRAGDVQENTDG